MRHSILFILAFFLLGGLLFYAGILSKGSGEIAHAASLTSTKSGIWSDPTVWSTGTVPTAADSVTIAAGHTVTYDLTDSRVAGVAILGGGKLSFQPSKTVLLRTDKNIVNQGTLEMKPSSSSIHHTIQFEDIDELQYIGGGMTVLDTDVGLWTTGSGVLDIAGSPKTAWTRLQGSATAGNTQIILQATPAGWQVGDELSIVPTEHPSVGSRSWNGFEVRTITTISGNTVTLNSPLSHNHPAATDPNSGNTYTAEVLNLTRNVHIQGTGDGSADPARNGRAHVIIMGATSPQFIKYAEFRHLGPRNYGGRATSGTLGRYSLHFHHSGDGVRGSVIEGTVVRQSGGHAYVPHASHGITLKNTIAYDGWDDVYWWDPPVAGTVSGGSSGADAIARHTANNSNDILYDGAFVAIAKFDPAFAAFYTTGFTLGAGSGNEIRNSVAIGVQGATCSSCNANGFHWPSTANQNDGGNVWMFNQGNVAHNNQVHGIFTWQNDSNTHIIENFVAYHNGGSAVDHGAYGNNYQYKNVIGFGNGRYGAESHAAAPSTNVGRADGYSLVFENYKATEPLIFPKHNAAPSLPTLFKDCIFSGVVINDAEDGGKHRTKSDFVNCTKPNGQSLEPTDFTLQQVNPNLEIRVQRPNGTAYSIGDGKITANIAAFYAISPISTSTPDPTASFQASPGSVIQGGSSTLSWSSTNATTCEVTFTDLNGVVQTVSTGNNTAGSVTITPAQTVTYDLTCSSASKSITKSATVTVLLPAPIASLVANFVSINTGQSATLTWSSQNTTQCVGTNFSTGGVTSGNAVVSPSTTTTYTLECIQPGQSSGDPTKTVTDSVTISVIPISTTTPSPTPTSSSSIPSLRTRGDFNGDGKINIADVSYLLSRWGSLLFNHLVEVDINGPARVPDGKIDIYDANKLMANWSGSLLVIPTSTPSPSSSSLGNLKGWHAQATTLIEGVDAGDHCVAWPASGFFQPRYYDLIDPSIDWTVGTTDWGNGLGNAPRYSRWYDCVTSSNTNPNASPAWMGYPGITHMHMTNSGKLSPYLSSTNHVPIVGFYWYAGDVNFTANSASAVAFIQSKANDTHAAGKEFVIGLDGTLPNLGQLAAPADYVLINHSVACQAGTLGSATDQLLADLSAAGANGQLAVGFTVGQTFAPVAVNGVSVAQAHSCYKDLRDRGVRVWLIDHPLDPGPVDQFHRENRALQIVPSPPRVPPTWPPPDGP